MPYCGVVSGKVGGRFPVRPGAIDDRRAALAAEAAHDSRAGFRNI